MKYNKEVKGERKSENALCEYEYLKWILGNLHSNKHVSSISGIKMKMKWNCND